MGIKKIGLFPNHKNESLIVRDLLVKKLENFDYIIDQNDFDLAIAIGGDGSFLHMVEDCFFDEDIYYIGINTGTLGFAQDIYPEDIDSFIKKLSEDKWKIEEIGTLKTKIYTDWLSDEKFSLNEMIIRNSKLGKMQTKILVNEELLGKFIGDGLLISTSFGSTAQNLSYNGAMVYHELQAMQLTPMGPISSQSYHSLSNSIVMSEDREITIKPDDENRNIMVTSDGQQKIYNHVKCIETSVKKKIKCLRLTDYDYTTRIHEKFLK